MPTIEIAVVPVGTRVPSMAQQVEAAQEAAQRRGIKHQVTPMATILEGSLQDVLECAREMHEAALRSGSPRVVTQITIDHRLEGGTEGRFEERERGGERRGEREGQRRERSERGEAEVAGAGQRIPAGRAR